MPSPTCPFIEGAHRAHGCIVSGRETSANTPSRHVATYGAEKLGAARQASAQEDLNLGGATRLAALQSKVVNHYFRIISLRHDNSDCIFLHCTVMVMSVLMSVLPSPDLLPLELSPAGQGTRGCSLQSSALAAQVVSRCQHVCCLSACALPFSYSHTHIHTHRTSLDVQRGRKHDVPPDGGGALRELLFQAFVTYHL